TAQPWPCQRRQAGGDGAGATAAKKPGGAQAPHFRHSAPCGGAAVLCQAVFPSHHGLLAAVCEELCPEPERRLRQSRCGAVAGAVGEEREGRMGQRLWFMGFVVVVLTCTLGVAPVLVAPPEGTLTVAVATFGNERWLPHQYVAAEDIVLKPMLENLLNRDPKTGAMIPMLAERWEILDGGRSWKFYLRKGVPF